jgi:hypothetical protein
MDTLHLMIALGPAAVYCLLVGALNLRLRPFVTNGVRDTLALAVAVSGFAVAGPMELFFPEAAAASFGVWIWPMLLMFYVLLVTLVILLLRPRIVVYNATAEQLRPALADIMPRLDPEARFVGDTLFLPKLGVQLHVEAFPGLKNVQLKAVGIQQSFEGWETLEGELRRSVRTVPGTLNHFGALFLMIGLALTAWISFSAVFHRERISHSFYSMLRMEE